MMTRAGELALAALGFDGITLPRIAIFSNNMTPTKLSVYADFTIAAYTGYANAIVTLSDPFVSQPDDKVASACSQAVFTGPTAGAGVDAFGWYLFDNTTHSVWAAGKFADGPRSLQNALDRLAVNVELQLTGGEDSSVES